MKLKITNENVAAEVAVIPCRKDAVDWSAITARVGIELKSDFDGSFQTVELVYAPTGNTLYILLGIGEEKDQPKLSFLGRWLGHTYQKKLKNSLLLDAGDLSTFEINQLVHGLKLATYQVGQMKSDGPSQEGFYSQGFMIVINTDQDDLLPECQEAITTAETQMRIMQLVDAPGNVKTPEYLAQWAIDSGKTYGYRTEVLHKYQLKEEGLQALLAVGQGSQHPPLMIKMEYKPETVTATTPKLGLVGKGITFDTGGLSIKSSTNLHYMKSDMGGAAAVLGAMELAARLRLNIHLIGLVPSAENSVDALSVKPGDVIGSYSGKTIEIIDTDAEGRLILADGLAYMQKNYNPDTIIDLATLTGSSVMTLGYAAGAMLTQHEDLASELTAAGIGVNERVWQLPLWDDYKDDIHSDIADVRNFSGKPIAGAITAAKFLESFLVDNPRWAHLDIAGVAFGDSSFAKMKTSTGFGVRLLINYIKAYIGS